MVNYLQVFPTKFYFNFSFSPWMLHVHPPRLPWFDFTNIIPQKLALTSPTSGGRLVTNKFFVHTSMLIHIHLSLWFEGLNRNLVYAALDTSVCYWFRYPVTFIFSRGWGVQHTQYGHLVGRWRHVISTRKQQYIAVLVIDQRSPWQWYMTCH
jgi:hypothetical protein